MEANYSAQFYHILWPCFVLPACNYEASHEICFLETAEIQTSYQYNIRRFVRLRRFVRPLVWKRPLPTPYLARISHRSTDYGKMRDMWRLRDTSQDLWKRLLASPGWVFTACPLHATNHVTSIIPQSILRTSLFSINKSFAVAVLFTLRTMCYSNHITEECQSNYSWWWFVDTLHCLLFN